MNFHRITSRLIQTPPDHQSLVLEPEDVDLPLLAAMGNADAQNALATIYMEQNQGYSALYWFKQAAEQGHAEAMNWLARCYLDGKFIAEDGNLGIMWLAKAAVHGHVISQGQMRAMIQAFVSKR